jgi:hypothetical protein
MLNDEFIGLIVFILLNNLFLAFISLEVASFSYFLIKPYLN